jgi:hypothetical protein
MASFASESQIPGEWVGRFQVGSVLRVDPLGRLVRAHAPDLDRAVLLYELLLYELAPPPALSAEQRQTLMRAFEVFCREVAQVRHPAVARPFDFGVTSQGTHFLAYEDLAQNGEGTAPGDPGSVVRTGARLCDALGALEGPGIFVTRVPYESLRPLPGGEVSVLPFGIVDLSLSCGLPLASAAPDHFCAPEIGVGADPPRALV